MKMPKVELHCHLDGAIPNNLFCKYSRQLGFLADDVSDAQWIKEHTMTQSMTLVEALAQFDLLLKLLLDPAHLTEVTHQLLNDMYDSGTRLAEIRFAPQSHKPGMTMEQAVEAVLKGREMALKDHPDMVSGILLCMMNYAVEGNLEDNLKTVELAAKYKDQGVVGVDLAGSEGTVPMSYFTPGFELARKLGVNYTIHAGESAGPANVQYALDQGASRVGHGVQSIYDPKVVENLIEKQATLEVSVTSNIFAKTFDSFENHPVKKLFDQGVRININTDDPLLLGITLEDEYNLLHQKYGFTQKDLIKTNLYGAQASFCPGKEKIIEELEKLLEKE